CGALRYSCREHSGLAVLMLPPTAMRSSGSGVAADGQDDVADLALGLDIPGRLDYLLQGVAPIDDHPIFTRLEVCPSQAQQRIESAVADRRGPREAHTSWHVRDAGACAQADELSVCPELEPNAAEDAVADRELADDRADGCDLSGELGAEDALLRLAQTRDRATEERDGEAASSVGVTRRAVCPGDRCGMNPDEDFVLFGDRSLDVFEA